MNFRPTRLSSTTPPCKQLPPNSIDPFLNEIESDCQKTLPQNQILSSSHNSNNNHTRHQPRVIAIIGRLFTKSSSEKSIKSSRGPWDIWHLGSDTTAASSPPAHNNLHNHFQLHQPDCPSPAASHHHQVHHHHQCALPNLSENQFSCRSRLEGRAIDAVSRCSLLPHSRMSIHSNNDLRPPSIEECLFKRPLRQSSSHSISASRRARQARRDLNAAKKSLPVLEKYARSATAQRR